MEKIEATKEGALDTADRIKVLQASFSELGKGFVKNITSFEVIAAFALKSAIEASKQTAELQKETGMSYKNAYLLKQEMSGVAIASGDAFVTTEKLMKAAASLTHELGMSAEVLGHEALVSAANLEQKLGTESGLLSNASKVNPFAGTFKGESILPNKLQLNKLDDPNAFYRLTKDPENYGLALDSYFNKGVPLTKELAETFPNT